MSRWQESMDELHGALRRTSVRGPSGEEIAPDDAFERWRGETLKTRTGRRTVYLIGNGASASMASHVSADLAKNAYVHTEVFSDLALITAIANDISYEEVFAEPLRRRMASGDMLVAISSSGRSPNILRAVQEARGLGGFVVTLSAMSPENPLRASGTLNVHVPAATYGMAESCHAAVLHHWIDLMTSASADQKNEGNASDG